MHAPPSGRCALALALFVCPWLTNAFIVAPSSVASLWRQRQHQHGACSRLFMTAEPGSRSQPTTPLSEASSSRRAFLGRGAAAAAWGLVLASAAPAPSTAKDVGGIDVRGIDVAEMLHPGVGGLGGKASKPLRDCVLNVERVRISTQQVRYDQAFNI